MRRNKTKRDLSVYNPASTKYLYERILIYGLLTGLAALWLFPLFWMFSVSFKTVREIVHYPPTIIPKSPTLEHYKALGQYPFGRYYVNSIFVSTVVVGAQLLFCSLSGYVFAMHEFRGRKLLFLITLSSMMVPFQTKMIPLYVMIVDFGWADTLTGVIATGLVSSFGIFFMSQFMHSIPSSLVEAARIDGCREYGIFFRIILPLCKPALAVLGIFQFTFSWHNFLWPIIVLNTPSKFTLPLGLYAFQCENVNNYGLVMAGTVLTIAPVLIVFLFFQRQLTKGIVLTGLKL